MSGGVARRPHPPSCRRTQRRPRRSTTVGARGRPRRPRRGPTASPAGDPRSPPSAGTTTRRPCPPGEERGHHRGDHGRAEVGKILACGPTRLPTRVAYAWDGSGRRPVGNRWLSAADGGNKPVPDHIRCGTFPLVPPTAVIVRRTPVPVGVDRRLTVAALAADADRLSACSARWLTYSSLYAGEEQRSRPIPSEPISHAARAGTTTLTLCEYDRPDVHQVRDDFADEERTAAVENAFGLAAMGSANEICANVWIPHFTDAPMDAGIGDASTRPRASRTPIGRDADAGAVAMTTGQGRR